jgi:hypothetical protein
VNKRWQRFLDWWLGPKCSKHGERQSSFARNFPCDLCFFEWMHEREREEREAKDAREINLMAAAFRRVLDERGLLQPSAPAAKESE